MTSQPTIPLEAETVVPSVTDMDFPPASATTESDDLEALLSTDAESDDLEMFLSARPPRRKLPKVTLLLATGVLLGAGFTGGVEAQKHLGSSSSSSSALATALREASSAASHALAGETIGTVLLVDGSTVYVTSTSGGIVKVLTTPATTVEVTQSATVGALKPGEDVVVRGSTTSNGIVSASSISEESAGGSGYSGAGGGG